MGHDSVNFLAPGFCFHPTNEKLVHYYLKRKVCNKPFRFNPISEVDVYKSKPWDLPGLEWRGHDSKITFLWAWLRRMSGNGILLSVLVQTKWLPMPVSYLNMELNQYALQTLPSNFPQVPPLTAFGPHRSMHEFSL
ncbi:hypothetical protein SLEP1_g49343 [Rubroshorea leprosula]|uniref:NAC domain-containing protein n=1 Tax=Rubroshorea leprosula TaxID=152421 RepID=A0AAV5LXG9_9ROSI|nr:hypothetical protein SLEP1_g49343 [Rubroshorea leprosula]